jgi:hypothetical protein
VLLIVLLPLGGSLLYLLVWGINRYQRRARAALPWRHRAQHSVALASYIFDGNGIGGHFVQALQTGPMRAACRCAC